ncbi:bromodomain containing protein [Stylonychia lemnae]|uniref:Bromodomain containing protein n=1 Tax=Stylonychia lemnae TaxID=5949 RepID=A0A077ZPK0_STYLE|nr:bromodomain containing protein [Stylonychia lemnae]|eukprot:CDW71912.1 bromodomain containing protein [Stylonychia lemnae]
MDQGNQQNLNQTPYDAASYQTNLHQAQFSQHMVQFDQQKQQQLQSTDYPSQFGGQIAQQDHVMSVQYQSQPIDDKQNPGVVYNHSQVSANMQGFYQAPMYQAELSDQFRQQQEVPGYQQQVIYQMDHSQHNQILGNQQFALQNQVALEQASQNIQPPSINATPSFGQQQYNQFQQQPRVLTQQIPQQIPQQQNEVPQTTHNQMNNQIPSGQLQQHTTQIKVEEERGLNGRANYHESSPRLQNNQGYSQSQLQQQQINNRAPVQQQHVQQQQSPYMQQMNRPPQNSQSGYQQAGSNFQRPQTLGSQMNQSSGQNQQIQNFVKLLIELVKKGEIDQVMQEINRAGIEASNLVDETNFKQTLVFSATLIPDDARSVQMVQVLKQLGVSPSQPDTLSQTALYYAAREGKNQLCDYLIENGCKVNHIDTYGQNPIFYACREGKLETVKSLIAKGSDADLVDNNGQTPIFYAIKHGKIEVVETLIEYGAKLDTSDKKGLNVIQWTKRSKKDHIMDLLVKKGAQPPQDPNQKNKGGKSKAAPVAPPQPRVNEKKIPFRYQLTLLKDGQYQPLSDDEWQAFKQENPDLVKYFESPDDPNVCQDLQIPDVLDIAPIYDCWDKAAKRMIQSLWKHQNSWIFYEPVDPVKLNIHDYFEIIKQPMDLSTIKQKLSNNQYDKMYEFLTDVQLMFDNCILYNGESTQVSILCKTVRDEFHKIYKNLNIDFYI